MQRSSTAPKHLSTQHSVIQKNETHFTTGFVMTTGGAVSKYKKKTLQEDIIYRYINARIFLTIDNRIELLCHEQNVPREGEKKHIAVK